MRLRHLPFALSLAVLLVACRSNVDKDSPSPTRTAKRAFVAQQLAAAASAQAMASATAAQATQSVAGNMHSTGGELGTWNVELGDCQSGESKGFFGVDFTAANSSALRLRYVHDEAAGDIMKVMIPSQKDTATVFDRDAKCAVLEGNIEKENITTWTPKGNIRHVKGHLKFDCKHDNGKGHITGEATFSDCH